MISFFFSSVVIEPVIIFFSFLLNYVFFLSFSDTLLHFRLVLYTDCNSRVNESNYFRNYFLFVKFAAVKSKKLAKNV